MIIRPDGNLLTKEMMQFGNQVRPRAEIESTLAKAKLRPQELSLARQLIAASAEKSVDWAAQMDERADDLRKVIESKVKGRDDVIEVKPHKHFAGAVSLMDMLRRSVKGDKSKKPKVAKTATPKLRVVAHRPRRKSG